MLNLGFCCSAYTFHFNRNLFISESWLIESKLGGSNPLPTPLRFIKRKRQVFACLFLFMVAGRGFFIALLRCPTKSSQCFARFYSTAATSSPCFIVHRTRFGSSPPDLRSVGFTPYHKDRGHTKPCVLCLYGCTFASKIELFSYKWSVGVILRL